MANTNVIDYSGNTIKADKFQGNVQQVAEVDTISTADATDAGETQALANELKAKVNELINALNGA